MPTHKPHVGGGTIKHKRQLIHDLKKSSSSYDRGNKTKPGMDRKTFEINASKSTRANFNNAAKGIASALGYDRSGPATKKASASARAMDKTQDQPAKKKKRKKKKKKKMGAPTRIDGYSRSGY